MRDLRAAIRNQPAVDHPYDWDPLHMPGSVQSYGVLLVAHAQSRKILFASENAQALLGVAATDLLNKSYLSLTDHAAERRVMQEQIGPDTILFPNPVRLTIQGRKFDAVFHAQGDTHQIEIEPVAAEQAAYGDMSDRAVEELFDPGTEEELYQRAVRVVRAVTGFDRVMLYRFDERYNGQVLAESARDGIGSFLGLFFPSSDIAARARELYLQNFTRYIPDITAPAHGLVGVHPGGGAAASGHPVDMTHANLRSVVPCHIEYLSNMGVKASMSFSINVDNRLWGLFACHHYAPRQVSYEQRVVCEQTAMMFIFKLITMGSSAARMAQRAGAVQAIGANLQVGAVLGRRLAAMAADLESEAGRAAGTRMLGRALAAIQAETNWLAPGCGGQDAGGPPAESPTLTPSQKMLLDIVEADSAAVVRHGHVYRIGDAPSAMAIYAIASMFGRELPDLRGGNLPVYATDNLSRVAPVTAAVKDRAAGVLALSLSDDVQAMVLWFRREQIVHATWAGNPGAVDATYRPGRANPRGSFEAWKEDIRDLSRPWAVEDVEAAHELLQAIRAADGAEDLSVPVFSAPASLTDAAMPRAGDNVVPVRPAVARAGEGRGTGLAPPPAARPASPSRRVIRVGQI